MIFLGLDIGTSGARAIAIEDGAIVAEATATYPLSTPHPGWAEQDPEHWWAATREVLARVANGLDGEIGGLGLTGQMHGAVFLDGAGAVIRPALLWNDQRTAEQCAAIETALGDRLSAIAGNPALTGFQAPKILWLRDHEPDAYARVHSVLLPKDFVRLRLTGERATDMSDASGTLLLDVGARAWSDEILTALDIDRAWLPEAFEGPEVTGGLRSPVAAELGLPAGLPVVAGGGDNAAAAVGSGVTQPGTLLASLGTSGVLFAPAEGFRPDPSGRVHAFAHALPGVWHLMAVILSAGGSLRWWADVTGATPGALAEQAAPSSRGLVFLPYLTGERTPHLDPEARGGFVGLTVRHGRPEMTRAVLEGVAFALRDGLDIIDGLGAAADTVRAVGGGSRSPVWCQILADVLGRPIVRATVDEGPAYGAALLAAGTPDHASAGAVVAEPQADLSEAYGVFRDLYGALTPATRRLTALDR